MNGCEACNLHDSKTFLLKILKGIQNPLLGCWEHGYSHASFWFCSGHGAVSSLSCLLSDCLKCAESMSTVPTVLTLLTAPLVPAGLTVCAQCVCVCVRRALCVCLVYVLIVCVLSVFVCA